MIINNRPFTKESFDSFARPLLEIIITNPSTKEFVKKRALIDTGADQCAFPPYIAKWLGYVLEEGEHSKITTAKKKANAYAHPTRIVFDYYPSNPASGVQQFSTGDIMVNYQEDLQMPLLGVENFLSNFILTVDYKKQVFSLNHKEV